MVNRFSATRPGSWLVKHFAAHVDPVVFRWTNGRFTSTGVPTLPMLTLTVPGRKSGEPRSVQLEVTATVLFDDEKAAVWDEIAATIPQMHTYVQRTDRNIRVFRPTPVTPT